MKKMLNNELYEKILDDSGFLNDCFVMEDNTTKYSILENAGFDLNDLYLKHLERTHDCKADDREEGCEVCAEIRRYKGELANEKLGL
jgi:hypothetical protein